MRQLICLGIILSLLLTGCSIGTPTQKFSRHELIATVLPTACMIAKYVGGQYDGGGSGTCIAIRKEGDIAVAYILTAKHVVEFEGIKVSVRFWQYGANHSVLQSCVVESCRTVWVSEHIDAAIVKVNNPPDFLKAARLMFPFDYCKLRIGDTTLRAGCPGRLPPHCTFGNIARFDVWIGDPFDQRLLMVTMGTTYGDSGSGVFDTETAQLIAITVMRKASACYIGGCVSVVDVIEELEHSDLYFILGDENG
jgi:S1-C subfamily serine protease